MTNLQSAFDIMQEFKQVLLNKWTRRKTMTVLEFRIFLLEAQEQVIKKYLDKVKEQA